MSWFKLSEKRRAEIFQAGYDAAKAKGALAPDPAYPYKSERYNAWHDGWGRAMCEPKTAQALQTYDAFMRATSRDEMLSIIARDKG